MNEIINARLNLARCPVWQVLCSRGYRQWIYYSECMELRMEQCVLRKLKVWSPSALTGNLAVNNGVSEV